MLRTLFTALAASLLALPSSAGTVEFTVNSPLDLQDSNPGDGNCGIQLVPPFYACSIRAAIQELNETGGAGIQRIVTIPAGTYELTIPGTDEDLGATGDLDVFETMTIRGDGGMVTIDAQGLDRVLDLFTPSGTTRLRGLTLTGGHTTRGGGINLRVGATLIIDDFNTDEVILRGNQADFGGGMYAEGDLVEASKLVIENNTAAVAGGGLLVSGSGAFFGSQMALLENQAPTGSALVTEGSAQLFLGNTTISGNSGSPSALYAVAADLTVLRWTTIHDNEGIAIHSPVYLTLQASIISGGCTGVATNLADDGGSIESPGQSCGLSPITNQINVADPGLRPLSNYGGPSRTHALYPWSPARDIGLVGIMVDQRGAIRDSAEDSGSFEFDGVPDGPNVFGNGFESGDLQAWSAAVGFPPVGFWAKYIRRPGLYKKFSRLSSPGRVSPRGPSIA